MSEMEAVFYLVSCVSANIVNVNQLFPYAKYPQSDILINWQLLFP